MIDFHDRLPRDASDWRSVLRAAGVTPPAPAATARTDRPPTPDELSFCLYEVQQTRKLLAFALADAVCFGHTETPAKTLAEAIVRLGDVGDFLESWRRARRCPP